MKETGVMFCIVRNNKILMQQRDGNCKRFPYMWCLPGGTREENESYEVTLLREIKEEYDLDIKNEDCEYLMDYHDGATKVYICKISEKQEPHLKEGMAMKWMTIAEIEKLHLGFDQNKIIPFLKKVIQ
ncbi:MAG: NUDIX domain-containing protein [Candidatus Paceibacterota bacterium]